MRGEFLPVAEGHPILLDASTTEVLGDLETSVSPLLLRGFQLHTVLVPHAEGGKTRNIISPRFQGGEFFCPDPVRRGDCSPCVGAATTHED